MKTIALSLILLMVIGLGTDLSAQNSYTDSLKDILPNVEGIEKVDILLELSLKPFPNKLESQLQFANEALQLSNSIDYLKGEAKALYSISFYYLFATKYDIAQERIKESIKINLEVGDSMDISNSYRLYGYILTDISDYNNSISNLNLSLSYLPNDSLKKRYQILENIGIAQYNLTNYTVSLKTLLSVLKFHEKMENNMELAHLYSLIGNIYIETGQKLVGMQYLKKALNIGRDIDNNFLISEASLSLGKFYKNEEKLDSALLYLYIALEYGLMEDHKFLISDSYTELGESYIMINNNDSALFCFKKVLYVSEEVGDNWAIVYGNIGLSKVYKNKREYNKSLYYLDKVKSMAEDIKSKTMLKDLYESLSETYALSGQYTKAYEYQILYKNISDSLHNELTTKELANLKINYETGKKEAENRRLLAENKLKEQTINNQKLIGLGIFVVLLLSLILAWVFFRTKEKIRKTNFILKERNQEIQNQNEEITVQAEELSVAYTKLKELDEFKQGLTNMIVHDLKNPLNIILNLSEKQLVKEAGNKMLNLVTNILDVSRFEETKMNLKIESFALKKVIDLSIKKTSFVAGISGIEIINESNDEIKVNADPGLTERIFINLITNGVKFSPKKSKIFISTENLMNGKFIKVCIKDSGSGIPEEFVDHIFDKFAQVTAIDSENMRSTGLGLTFCKMAVEAHGGTIGVESIVKEGSNFWFTLPRA